MSDIYVYGNVCIHVWSFVSEYNLTRLLQIFTFLPSGVWNFDQEFRERPTAEKCGSDTSFIIIDSIIDHRSAPEKLKEAIRARTFDPSHRCITRLYLCCLCQWQTQKMLLTVMKSFAELNDEMYIVRRRSHPTKPKGIYPPI